MPLYFQTGHLLRDLNFLKEFEKHSFASKFKTFLGVVFDLKKTVVLQKTPCQVDTPEAILLEKRLNKLLVVTIDVEKCPKMTIFLHSMIKYKNYLLSFIYDLAIAPDDNTSKRAISIIKIKQKISGQFKKGQHTFCAICSVMDTLIKINLEVIYHINKIAKLQ